MAMDRVGIQNIVQPIRGAILLILIDQRFHLDVTQQGTSPRPLGVNMVGHDLRRG